MKRLLTALCLGVWLVSLAGAEESAPKERPAGHTGQYGPGLLLPQAVLADLQLTDAQQAQYKELQAKFDKERAGLTAGHPDQMLELRKQLKAAEEAKDEAKITALRQQMGELMKPMRELREKYMKEVRAMLTPEQMTKLDAALKKFREHGGGHRQHGAAVTR